MQWWEYALEALGIISTVISVIAAIKSVKYYKKNKHLTLLVNANNALLEMQKNFYYHGRGFKTIEH